MSASTRPTSRLVGLALVGGLLVTGAAACGSSSSSTGANASKTLSSKDAASLSPADLLTKGLDGATAGSAETITFKYGGTAADLTSALATGTSTDAQKALITKVLMGNITYAVKTTDGSKLADAAKNPGKTNVDVAAVVDSDSVFEFKTVAGDVYLKADVNKIATLAGQDPSQLTALTGSLPPSFSFVNNAIAGDWLKISKADIASVTALLKKQAASAAASASAAPAASIDTAMLTSDLKGALLKDVTVTKGTNDPTLGQQLVITGQTKQVTTDVLAVLKKDLPQYATELDKSDPSTIMDKKVTFDAYVLNGDLTRLSIDVGQFDTTDATMPKLPLVLDFKGSASDIAAPASSTDVPVAMLLQQFGSQLGGLGSSLTGELGGIATKA